MGVVGGMVGYLVGEGCVGDVMGGGVVVGVGMGMVVMVVMVGMVGGWWEWWGNGGVMVV